jgi:hypothetical protein
MNAPLNYGMPIAVTLKCTFQASSADKADQQAADPTFGFGTAQPPCQQGCQYVIDPNTGLATAPLGVGNTAGTVTVTATSVAVPGIALTPLPSPTTTVITPDLPVDSTRALAFDDVPSLIAHPHPRAGGPGEGRPVAPELAVGRQAPRKAPSGFCNCGIRR